MELGHALMQILQEEVDTSLLQGLVFTNQPKYVCQLPQSFKLRDYDARVEKAGLKLLSFPIIE